MKKHYAFIPLKEKDLSNFRKSILAGLSLRPIFATCTLLILVLIGFLNQDLLIDNPASLVVFSLATAIVIYLLFLEIQKLFIVARLHKSNLLPFIHVRNSDDSFYIEELNNGFIIQTEPVNLTDISFCMDLLTDMKTQFTEYAQLAEFSQLTDATRLMTYLHSCINSKDDRLVNKAVIYIEIIKSQLDKGNQDILLSYDKLSNYKDELG